MVGDPHILVLRFESALVPTAASCSCPPWKEEVIVRVESLPPPHTGDMVCICSTLLPPWLWHSWCGNVCSQPAVGTLCFCLSKLQCHLPYHHPCGHQVTSWLLQFWSASLQGNGEWTCLLGVCHPFGRHRKLQGLAWPLPGHCGYLHLSVTAFRLKCVCVYK